MIWCWPVRRRENWQDCFCHGRQAARNTPLSREIRIRNGVTHEEMAQMIGASRETVTRLLSDLKKKELIRLDGSTLVIRNRTALEAMSA